MIGENLGDKNYRIHGSGVDEPGINLMARLAREVLGSRCRRYGFSVPFEFPLHFTKGVFDRRESAAGDDRVAARAVAPASPAGRHRRARRGHQSRSAGRACSATRRSTPRRSSSVGPPVIVPGGEAVKNDIAHALSLLKAHQRRRPRSPVVRGDRRRRRRARHGVVRGGDRASRHSRRSASRPRCSRRPIPASA